jgi:monoamine oxidase
MDAPTVWFPLGAEQPVPDRFTPLWTAFCREIRQLSAETLATHTLRDIVTTLLGAEEGESLLTFYPYRTELNSLRADLGLHAFEAELGATHGYRTVREGLSAIIEGLARDLTEAGGTLVTNTRVVDVKREGATYRVICAGTRKTYTADRVILALPVSALGALPVMRHVPILQHLRMAPLTRLYAEIPGGWVARTPRTITDSPLRYIIPVDPRRGIIMISYTDGRDTKRWRGLTGEDLVTAVHDEMKRLYGEDAPRPRWVRAAEWTEGTTYWLPGTYSPIEESTIALRPRVDMPGLHCCGESFSVTRQAWMEGALEHAELLWAALQAEPNHARRSV